MTSQICEKVLRRVIDKLRDDRGPQQVGELDPEQAYNFALSSVAQAPEDALRETQQEQAPSGASAAEGSASTPCLP